MTADFQGGTEFFTHLGVEVKPATGSLLVGGNAPWTSYDAEGQHTAMSGLSCHETPAVTKGVKYSF